MFINRLGAAVALTIFILCAAAGIKYAEGADMLGQEGAKRTIQVLIGLVLAAYGNLMPKQLGRPRLSPYAEASVQAALRAGGWSMALAGLAYAGLWALAPLPVADIAGTAVVVVAIAITFGYALWSFTACRRAVDTPAGR